MTWSRGTPRPTWLLVLPWQPVCPKTPQAPATHPELVAGAEEQRLRLGLEAFFSGQSGDDCELLVILAGTGPISGAGPTSGSIHVESRLNGRSVTVETGFF